MDINTITLETFITLNESEKVQCLKDIKHNFQFEKVIEILLELGLENLSGLVLSELAKVYNNWSQFEEAKRVLEMVSEEDRDAIWYYRNGFTHWRLSSDPNKDFETEANQSLALLENAIKNAGSPTNPVIEWCIELVKVGSLKEVFEGKPTEYPLLQKYYFEDVNETNQEMKTAQNKKLCKNITIEDVQNAEDSWDIIEPVYETVNIYNTYKDYLDSAKIFTLEQRYLLAIIWYFIEVNNGGHYQFFDNSTGIVWKDTLKGFELFGMKEHASNFKNLLAYFGGTISFVREERTELLTQMEEEYGDDFYQKLDEADDFVYDYDGNENELSFIQKNPEKFIFHGSADKS